jgi:nucleotide-binding universal stress UspA family protein
VIKTILVPTSGSSTDRSVFGTALALARPLAAHIEFLHIHLTPGAAALHTPHVAFLRGAAVGSALTALGREEDELSAQALAHFKEFCLEHRVLIRDAPKPVELVSARYSQEIDQPLARLLLQARHSDLVVLGRRRHRDHLQLGLIEELLARAGRPVVIANDSPPQSVAGTIVVGWKETAEAARAVGAAMPLLRAATRVVLLAVKEQGSASREQLEHLGRQLAWQGINAEVDIAGNPSQPAAQQLALRASQLYADLLVVGAYGHGPLRERVFGGVTRTLLQHADMPVFMMQ